jgi:hypothetical protein
VIIAQTEKVVTADSNCEVVTFLLRRTITCMIVEISELRDELRKNIILALVIYPLTVNLWQPLDMVFPPKIEQLFCL